MYSSGVVLKKSITVVLIAIFFYNIAGFLLIHPLLQSYYKYLGMKRAAAVQGENSVELIVVNKEDVLSHKSDFLKINSYEFRLNGNLYDILKEVHLNSLIYLYCVNDAQEDQLEKDFQKKLDSNSSDRTQIPDDYNQLYPLFSEAVSYLKLDQMDVHQLEIHLYKKAKYIQYLGDIPTPPPKLFLSL